MISVIDTTDIILAAHLMKKESNHPVSSNVDKANNITMIGKNIINTKERCLELNIIQRVKKKERLIVELLRNIDYMYMK